MVQIKYSGISIQGKLLGQRQVSSEYRLGCLTQHKISFWRTDDQGLCKNLNTDKSTDCYRVHGLLLCVNCLLKKSLYTQKSLSCHSAFVGWIIDNWSSPSTSVLLSLFSKVSLDMR